MAVFRRMRLMPAPEGRRAYPSDLTDAQWAVLEPRLREFSADGPGRPPTVDRREVVNALLYIKQTGCPWRYVPHDLPPRSTVHYYFEKWTADGTLEAALGQLRERVRRHAGREAQPTAGLSTARRSRWWAPPRTSAGTAGNDCRGANATWWWV